MGHAQMMKCVIVNEGDWYTALKQPFFGFSLKLFDGKNNKKNNLNFFKYVHLYAQEKETNILLQSRMSSHIEKACRAWKNQKNQ